HVTKDGSIAGPRLLEHLVDVVLSFEGDRHSTLRLVRATKNRFGPTDEVGCFELTDGGITGLPDPSGLFLAHHTEPVAGTCVTVALEGRRPLVAEVQALVTPTSQGNPRRTNSGLDAARIAMVIAVLTRRARLPLMGAEIFAATVGGVQLREPAADLAAALALASACIDRPLPTGLVAIGELGLAGEVRSVSGIERRMAEAARLGFTKALVPQFNGRVPDGLQARQVTDVHDALRTLLNVASPAPG
ncbi:MAG TPA: magnesium chelatase domain-containing protein, partial [Actinomycetes bacterium]|nr:magnesium chelatase domain-containing protein [Actinomycetes bacterium]